MNITSSKMFGTALLGVLALTASASAQTIIYQDSFTRTLPLNGTAPDVVNTGGTTWLANSGVTTDGALANEPTQSPAFLPFTLTAGNIYTLSANVTTSSGDWVAFGFSSTTNTASSVWHVGNTVGPWMLLKAPGQNPANQIQAFGGPGTTNNVFSGTGTQGSQYSITLNTTAAQWTYSFAGPGYTPTTYTLAANPAITAVGFGSTGGGSIGTFDNFTLSTSAVPEPSTYMLLGLGAAALLIVRRRSSRLPA